MQIVPFFVYGKDGENYNAENSRESYNLIFLVPAIGVKISDENMEKHRKYFGKQKGFKIQDEYDVLLPTQIADIRVTDEELGKVAAGFKTGNTSSISAVNSKKASRRSSPQSESFSMGRNKEYVVDNYDIFNTYNNKNSYRNFINMNDIILGKLSSHLFENNQAVLKEVITWSKIDNFKTGVVHAIFDAIKEKNQKNPGSDLVLITLIDDKIAEYFSGNKENIIEPKKFIDEINAITIQDFDVFKSDSEYASVSHLLTLHGDENLERIKKLLIKSINSDSSDKTKTQQSSPEQRFLEELKTYFPNLDIEKKSNYLKTSDRRSFLMLLNDFILKNDFDLILGPFSHYPRRIELTVKDSTISNAILNIDLTCGVRKNNVPVEILSILTINEKTINIACYQKNIFIDTLKLINKKNKKLSEDIENLGEDGIKRFTNGSYDNKEALLKDLSASSKESETESWEQDPKQKFLDAMKQYVTELDIDKPGSRTIKVSHDLFINLLENFILRSDINLELTNNDYIELFVEDNMIKSATTRIWMTIFKDKINLYVKLPKDAWEDELGPDTTIDIECKDKNIVIDTFKLINKKNKKLSEGIEKLDEFDYANFIYTASGDVPDNLKKDVVLSALNDDSEASEDGSGESGESKDSSEEVKEFIGDGIPDDTRKNSYKLDKDKFLERVKSLSVASSNIEIVINKELKCIELIYNKQKLFLLDLGAVFIKDIDNSEYCIFCVDDSIVKDTIQKLTEMYISNKKFIEEFKRNIDSKFGKGSGEYKAFEEKFNELNGDEESSEESEESSESQPESADDEPESGPQDSPEASEPDDVPENEQISVSGSFKGKLQNLYNKKVTISAPEADNIMDAIKIYGDDKLKKILGVVSTNESLIYKSLGLKLLIEEDVSTDKIKLEKIDINVIFRDIQQQLYETAVLHDKATEAIDLLRRESVDLNDKGETFKNAFKYLGMSRPRFDDIWSEGRPDFKLDFSKTISYAICEAILEDKEAVKEKGFDIVGSLKKLDDIRLGGGNILYSNRTYNRLKQEMKKSGENFEDLSRDDMNKALDESVRSQIEDICVAQHMKYDLDMVETVNEKVQKWRESDKMSQRDHDNIKKGGLNHDLLAKLPGFGASFAEKNRGSRALKGGGIAAGALVALGAISSNLFPPLGIAALGVAGASAAGYLTGKNADEETFTSVRDIYAKEPDVKKSVDKLFNEITALAADIKDIYLENVKIKGSLTSLLFESNLLFEADDKKLTYNKISKILKSKQILSFGFSKIEDAAGAQNELVDAVGGLLEDLFDIEIEGVSNGEAALAMQRITANFDSQASVGQPANETISAATQDAGIPTSLNDKMMPEQFLAMLNNSGGPMMAMFMMMMAQDPNFKKEMSAMFIEMAKGQMTGQEAAEKVKTAASEGSEKLDELDTLLEDAIKEARNNLPEMSKEQVKKIIEVINNSNFISFLDNFGIKKYTLNNAGIVAKITSRFKVVASIENDSSDLTPYMEKLLSSDIFYSGEAEKDEQTDFYISQIISLILRKEFSIEENRLDDAEKYNEEKAQKFKEEILKLNVMKESFRRRQKYIGQGESLSGLLFESDNKKSRRVNLSQKDRYNEDISFLRSEMKRIWKI
jgi:hypothetical protein